MTNEEKAAHVAALVEERTACVNSGKEERVAAIDANLRLLGAGGKAPAKRAEQRPAAQADKVESRDDS